MADGHDTSLGDLADGLSVLPSGRRETIAREVCKSDPASLDRLLSAISDSGQRSLETQIRDLLGPRPGEVPATPVDGAGPDLVGSRVGPYRVVARLGEGGFGVVYAGEQEHPIRRSVAIKLIKAGMDTRRVVARFEAERQALARMDHPNIARVLDAGTTVLGRPYFVMELVEGVPVTAFADRARLTIAQRLRLMLPICDAVQHAHHKGVVHRDLKPANVLVSHAGVPKVIDFGVAKALHGTLADRTLYTEARQLIGTPAYMSPEQVVQGADVDTRADVYALGVLLYELLASRPPFDADALASASVGEMERIIRDVDPPRPSTRVVGLPPGERIDAAAARGTSAQALGPSIAGDLDWVVMKAIDKDRDRRYETPEALAADIRRALDGLPVQARHPSRVYLVRKFVSRHRGPVIAGCLGGAVLVGLLIATAWGFATARIARDDLAGALGKSQIAERKASDAAAASRRQEYAGVMQAAYQMFAAGDGIGLATLLERAPEDLRGWEWRMLKAASEDGSPALSDAGRAALEERDRLERVNGEAVMPGVFAGLVGGPGTGVVRIRAGNDTVWVGREDTGGDVILSESRGTGLRSGCVSPDGRLIALGFDCGAVTVRSLRWDSSAQAAERGEATYFGVGLPLALAWTPDGTRLVARGSDGSVREWHVGDGSGRFASPAVRQRSGTATLSADGSRVYTSSWCDVTAYDALDGRPLWMTNLPETIGVSVEVERGSRVLALAVSGAGAYLLDARTGVRTRAWGSENALASDVRSVQRLDDNRVLLGLADGSVGVLDERTWQVSRLPLGGEAGAGVVQLVRLKSGQIAALVGQRVALIGPEVVRVSWASELPEGVTGIGAGDGELLLGTSDGGVIAWNLDGGLGAGKARWSARTLGGDAIVRLAPISGGAAGTPARVLAASERGTLAFFDGVTGEEVMEQRDAAPDPTLIAPGDDGAAVIVSSRLAGVLRLETTNDQDRQRAQSAVSRAHWRYVNTDRLLTSDARRRVLEATPGLAPGELGFAKTYNAAMGDHVRRLNSDVLYELLSPQRESKGALILEVTTRLIELAPDSAGIASTHAWALLNAGQAEGAIAQCARVSELQAAGGREPFAETMLILALAHARRGDLGAATDALRRAEAIMGADEKQRDTATTWLLARTRGELGQTPRPNN